MPSLTPGRGGVRARAEGIGSDPVVPHHVGTWQHEVKLEQAAVHELAARQNAGP
ncbi:hypothetical protein ABGB17_15310 [Sphaerisporangium sp. B11E5]|uniref:hypothetical protein n=1 Tax=Sphaerisporangium sp. B11E5 TaxID=3153563 RepID=UPI00325CE566